MAGKYALTTAWTQLSEGRGIMQNVGRTKLEIVTQSNETAGDGVTLIPGEKLKFEGTLSVRSMDAAGEVNVIDLGEE